MKPTPKDIEDVKIWLRGLSKEYDPNDERGPYQIRRNAYEYSALFGLSIYLNQEEGFIEIQVDDTLISRTYNATEVDLLRGMNEVAVIAAEEKKTKRHLALRDKRGYGEDFSSLLNY